MDNLAYGRMNKLGEGTYGVVYKAQDKSSGNLYAIKEIRTGTGDEGIPSTAIRELSLLKRLSHENVVRLHDVKFERYSLHLVFEYMQGDLHAYLKQIQPKRLNLSTTRKFSTQLIKGIDYLHSHGVLHRDLKPQNLLITDKTLKIADFGLCRTFGIPLRNYTHEIVTLWYRSPEVLLKSGQYSTPLDMWSVGCIMAEMLAGGSIFSGQTELDQLFSIFSKIGTPTHEQFRMISGYGEQMASFPEWQYSTIHPHLPSNADPDLLDLINRMLQLSPGDRISAKDSLRHPFIRSYKRTHNRNHH
ncbi:Pkinase-domain-containing protein [Conidiobolus coronatus NRRL 28638]|uniref:Cyclin-dependent kinase 1 n=1 Tax=Conidiobolus coronatus (strain ATCC 28846 / CBS 209.66 / NRRL 28638) TaxID=796925 RepID=A0A137PFI5_CONC2|nr:Pkinase-domain-containing protein [Conidiobolus coronatus NRRL 28638]|eukprot:KXN73763.1 Pkinase-domain-containing protein [Conidiobolus coronatus NRRL 28638]